MNSVKAVCIVELQIHCDSVWDEKTTMEQITKQAEDEVRGKIANLIKESRSIHLLSIKKIITQAVKE